MMPFFQVGDIVTLKSGGRSMTILAIENEQATVAWMDKLDRVRREEFPYASLRNSQGEFDGVGALFIEGLNCNSSEFAEYKKEFGNA